MKPKVLIIEDEDRMQRILQLLLEGNGFDVQTAGDGLAGMAAWDRWQPDVVLSDIKMPRADGFQLLNHKAEHHLEAPLVLMTAYGTIDMAVDAMKRGAFDYITKPFDNQRVLTVVQQALAARRRHRAAAGTPRAGEQERTLEMIGASAAMADIRKAIGVVADPPTSVMITGESGTGKGVVARAIHRRSRRCDTPLVTVNCASIPRDLLESELFGHRRGAFTGAVSNREGAFLKAHRGTLFLDEIADLPLDLQPKLLHAVEEKAVTPIGEDRCRCVDVKIISATNRDIRQMVADGLFREDLYYRLSAFPIAVPPLRERPEDIDELAAHFLTRYADAYHASVTSLDPEVRECLIHYRWPGNIRELRNVMERAVLSCQGPRLTLKELPPELKQAMATGGGTDRFDLAARERQLIAEALAACRGNQVRAAEMLSVTRNTLRYRMKKYGLME